MLALLVFQECIFTESDIETAHEEGNQGCGRNLSLKDSAQYIHRLANIACLVKKKIFSVKNSQSELGG
jgi:hypothetical protein